MYFAKNGLNVLAIDQCENMISTLNAKNSLTNLRFKSGDFTNLNDFNTLDFIESSDFSIDSKSNLSAGIDIIYSRFTLHSISKAQQERLFEWIFRNLKSGGLFCIEARGLKNSLYKKGVAVENEQNAYIYENHFRRFLDFDALLSELSSDYTILYAKEAKGFAPYKNEDDYFIRLIARKI